MAAEEGEATELARAVGALAASLKLPTLSEPEAARLAEREGLVTHLTSLVLVDEAGATQEDLPVLRKVALPTSAVMASIAPCAIPDAEFPVFAELPQLSDKLAPVSVRRALRAPSPAHWVPDDGLEAPESAASERQGLPASAPSPRPSSWNLLSRLSARPRVDLPEWLQGIDWSALGGELAAGEIKSLPRASANALVALSDTPWVLEKALALDVAPLLIAILAAALVAETYGDRGATRVARRILGAQPRTDLPPANDLLDRLRTVPITPR
jgi:hypothetical protein